MRDSKFIKKDEKHIPHFRRSELFPSGGGKPEGKEGEQYSHVKGRTLDSTLERAPSIHKNRTIIVRFCVLKSLLCDLRDFSSGFVTGGI